MKHPNSTCMSVSGMIHWSNTAERTVPIAQAYIIKKLCLSQGICPFNEWFDTLTQDDQIMVDDRLARVRQGSFGEINALGYGVSELKFRRGRALRVYYGQIGKQVILLIVGGDKSTQKRDIAKAIELFRLVKEGGIQHEDY